MATRIGGVVHIADAAVGLADGDYGAIPSDNTKPSGFVPRLTRFYDELAL